MNLWHPQPLATTTAVIVVAVVLGIVMAVYLSGYGNCC